MSILNKQITKIYPKASKFLENLRAKVNFILSLHKLIARKGNIL